MPGLDEILHGGLEPGRVYLVEGDPGSGKTTLGLRFALEAARNGEPCLYVTLAETREDLARTAASHRWSVEGLEIFELIASEEALKPESQYTIFQPSEVELGETLNAVLAEVDRVKPTRLVLDSLSELRLLAQNAFRYRRQTLALKQFFVGRGCTVLFLDDRTSDLRDLQLHSIAHGVISLEQHAPSYGPVRRRLRVVKMRGRDYASGYHDFRINEGGLQAYPRLVASEPIGVFPIEQLATGISELDQLLGGGIDRGTSVLMMGPAGSGKSTLALQCAAAAARRGERAVVFTFDETLQTLFARARGFGIDLESRENVHVQQIDPAELSAGEFTAIVRAQVERDGEDSASVLVIDSLNGYLHSMMDDRSIAVQLHELLTYLALRGVATILIVSQSGVIGPIMEAPIDATYLADTVILLRYYESSGAVHRAISVVKRRSGAHEPTIRELRFVDRKIHVGQPLNAFRGVLTGVPTLEDSRDGPTR